ncbi:heavy-metal-associated domain-containing protein [Schinkia sp. CFF1]
MGISCLNCIPSIEKEIHDLNGIFSFKGMLPKGKIVIKFNPSVVSSENIVDRIENKGFSVVKTIQKEERFVMFD